MEAVELNEESIEYRDPDGEFQVLYSFPRGYIAVGNTDNKNDVSGESFDNLDDAIEHAEICLSIADDARYDKENYRPEAPGYEASDYDESIEEDDDVDPETGDLREYHRTDEEFMSDIINLADEADEALADEGLDPAEQLDRLATIIRDVSNITRLRASGRPYTPIH